MANTLSNFVVGIGFESDEKSLKQVDSNIDSIKSKALAAGAALAGAFGIKSLTSDFASANDELGKFSQVFGLIPNDVAALGRALEHEGGTLDGLMSQLSSLESVRAGILAGNAQIIGELGKVGINSGPIYAAKDAAEAYIELARQFESLSSKQRVNAAQVLGFDEATIRLLSKGEDAVREIMRAEQEMRPVTEAMTKASADFNDETQDLGTNIGGFADKISTALLPEINAIIAGMNDWTDANRGLINQNLDKVLKPIAENFQAIATAGGLMATGGLLKVFGTMARVVPIIGTGIGTIVAGLGAIAGYAGLVVGGVALVSEAGPDGNLSATSLFGENGTTKFLDSTLDDLLQAKDDSSLVAPMVSGYAQGGSTPSVNVNVRLNGKVFDDAVVDVIETNNQQTINELQSSDGG